MTRMDDRTKRLNALGDGWTRLAAMAEQQDADRLTLLERIAEGMGRPPGLRDSADTAPSEPSASPLHSDPVGAAAMRGVPQPKGRADGSDYEPPPTPKEIMASFDKACDRAWSALGVALGIAERHQVRHPNLDDLKAAAKANGEPDCTSCARHGHTGVRTHPGLLVCQWCHRFTKDTGTEPTKGQVDAHHRGAKVFRKAPEQIRG